MVFLQNKLNLKVSQKQILTPGLVQMVSVLALNKLELKEMIDAEMVENPVLEEMEVSIPLLDDVAGKVEAREREETRERQEPEAVSATADKKDPFEEIDFGSFFRDYLDPGYRSFNEREDIERPSFENFLSQPATLSDHLLWQLGSVNVRPGVRAAAELVIGNLNEDGYLTASEDELLGASKKSAEGPEPQESALAGTVAVRAVVNGHHSHTPFELVVSRAVAPAGPPPSQISRSAVPDAPFVREDLGEAITLVQNFDPVGVAARGLRECLLIQIKHLQKTRDFEGSADPENDQVIEDAAKIVHGQLHLLQNKQYKEMARAIARPLEAVIQAHEFIRTLDPKPGLRYNKVEPKLIEPDVAFVKHGDEYLVMMNDEDLPQLRVSPTYRRMLHQGQTVEKDVRSYVKDRYKSAVQLIKNIEQRRQTILKVCYAIIRRQQEFLDRGIDMLKPMMIKEVAEEIGVHPSTVSRAVSNKYVHTVQGVFELRYFFSEGVQGPEGAGTSLLILKRRVKKLIEEEDSAHPLTDDQITRILQSQGIQVTRRTVAKYREDMKIPSTHQRRTRN
ncbi:MAG TPA: RNA polymerase factor sigma-54 [Candidatus Saccharimonadales bacterium]|jgi:RNA polymerase sigma-54 factor|nr:RNA polymerase factor sigma-54 [Candidatus Saccharimonadales bacterium]